ncbi:MAG TPA: hybrid sensor histidine kinase/response regulator, partial [Chthoniobacteraceae bacterium]
MVDDTPANLRVLSGMLKERGYKVRPVPGGRAALAAAKEEPPDLVLLDINMPDMNGYEVCAQMKRDERMQDIPVLFISALNETLDKVMAFGVGGVDYITKPFQFEEVAARVASHLKIRRLQLALESRNHELQQSNEELRRLQTLRDNLTNMIVHDLRSPLTGVVCAVEMIAMENEQLSSDAKKTLRHARTGLNQVIALINSVLDLGKIEAGELRPHRTMCDLLALARESAATLDPLRGSRKVTVECASETLPTYIDRDLMARVIQNFLGNAFKFTEENGTIVIRLEHANGGARLSVIDDGQGIPAEYHERIFDKYCQVNSDGPRIGTGLGLTFCRLAVEAHGGKIGVTSEPGKGSTFWLELPD